MKLLLCWVFTAVLLPWHVSPAGQFSRPLPELQPNLFVWADTCNVYVLREGNTALLIDLGDGTVLDHLSELGITRVDWVLFTHHHREQCQGAPSLRKWNPKIGAPEAERALFEKPSSFRKMEVRLNDPFTIHGASYVRPPTHPIQIDKAFDKADTFQWEGHEFTCVATPGNSPGAMSYLLRHGVSSVAFSGDVMLAGAKMHTWFDTEWDYGFAAGLYALHNSAGLLAGYDPLALLPAHGRDVREPRRELHDYMRKLRDLERLYVRGYHVSTFSSGYQDKVSRPTTIPMLAQVSPHLFKFKGPDFWPNFSLILADNGHALVVDCGLLDEALLDRTLHAMRTNYGLRQIDAVVITHMHGDHFLEVPYLKDKWGAEAWALELMATVCEHPERFDYAAPAQAYGKKGLTGLRLDRLFKPGETFTWQGHQFTVDWMPGQTEFALCMHGTIDGRKVAFTGDNLFGDPDDPLQTGHEAVVAHNSAILEEGYIYGAEYLKKLKPDLLMGGHSFVMDKPGKFIHRFRQWSYDLRDTFVSLIAQPDYRYGFDPYWVRAEPYRSSLKAGQAVELQLHIRNFMPRPEPQRIAILAPAGCVVEPAVIQVTLDGNARRTYPVRVRTEAAMKPGIHMLGFDVTRGGQRYGEWFDAVLNVEP